MGNRAHVLPVLVDAIFRKEKGNGGAVFALLPEHPGTNDPRTCTIFTHDGHTHGDFRSNMRRSIPASEDEAKSLRHRMEGSQYGYIVQEVSRGSVRYFRMRKEATR